MKVTFTFDVAATSAAGLRIEDVRHTIKKLFAERGLPYTSDGAELTFEDVGREDDYADMWHVILGLLKSAWFITSASSCLWEDEDGIEDVLAQAWKVRGNVETLAAIEEGERMLSDPDAPRFSSVEDLFAELDT